MTPSAPRRAWTSDEDVRLREAVATYGPRQWGQIALHVGQRKDWQCRERWHNNLAPELKKDAWSPEEDETLLHSFEVLNMVRSATTMRHIYPLLHPLLQALTSPPSRDARVGVPMAEMGSDQDAAARTDRPCTQEPLPLAPAADAAEAK
mmetsp:Transcript_26517/g.68435  ORF Transcript_26517/g.68435 Transcript_26517/m.68435 type:complete len:149 (-) Transcript_26517:1269-1715(-)